MNPNQVETLAKFVTNAHAVEVSFEQCPTIIIDNPNTVIRNIVNHSQYLRTKYENCIVFKVMVDQSQNEYDLVERITRCMYGSLSILNEAFSLKGSQ